MLSCCFGTKTDQSIGGLYLNWLPGWLVVDGDDDEDGDGDDDVTYLVLNVNSNEQGAC